ncbi:MAG TPA: hypothetical protein PK306_19510 [Aquabacterium sp.]|nr:hypothetical protein [Aquabacterium sp.]HQC97893.1 hypothetical protein [Aquabacterium sp.]
MVRLHPAGAAGRALAAAALAVAGAATAAPGATPDWAAMPPGLLPQRLPVAEAGGAGWLVQARAADFSASDATPVRGFGGDWARYHPRGGRNAALQQAGLELSLQGVGWELAAVLRGDLVVTGSRGSFDAVHAYKQRVAPADGTVLDARAEAQGVVWAGLRAARSWTLLPAREAGAAGLRITAALTPLQVRRVRLTGVQGSVQYDAATGYGFDATTLQQASDRQFGGQGTRDATGSGVTTDLGLLWQPAPGWFANLSLVDAVSRLRVDGVATEAMQLSSSTRQLDARGYLDYKPLLTGRNSASDLRLRLARKWSATAGMPAATLWAGAPAGSLVGARWERIDGLDLPAVWAALPVTALGPGWRLQVDAETRWRSLGVGLQGPHAALWLRSSSLRPGQAAALGWQASVNLPW